MSSRSHFAEPAVVRARRILFPLANFKPNTSQASTSAKDDFVIGEYSAEGSGFVVTACGLRVANREELLRYDEMMDIDVKEMEKSSATTLKIRLAAGGLVQLLVLGSSGRYRDVFEVQRFLMRVRDDIGRR